MSLTAKASSTKEHYNHGCCLKGPWLPRAPKIWPQVTKIYEEHAGEPVTQDSNGNSQYTNFWQTNNNNDNVSSSNCRIKFLLMKVNKQALVLNITSVTSAPGGFQCSAVEKWSRIYSLRKTFGTKIMTFSPDFSWSRILKGFIHVQKEKGKIVLVWPRPPKNVTLGGFML